MDKKNNKVAFELFSLFFVEQKRRLPAYASANVIDIVVQYDGTNNIAANPLALR
uniref:Uncharacterized protein n=1 Tax=Oryza sativa subsp. japonica TaxID=39947 RepID=Q6H5H2_ORYSJ|nr:hypothetical protein [Oryza sativa Japonica Group]